MSEENSYSPRKLAQLNDLISNFKLKIKDYINPNYDEANLRVDFIDKFFEILDWDVRNDQGALEEYREVVREDKIRIRGKPKAPDYSFRIGGRRVFFVEAKKPSISIKDNIEPAYQIRRYGYTAKLPISILTDFQEFAVYDTRIKPYKNDKAGVARIFYCTYEEYGKNFGFIYNTFSKTAVLKGSLKQYVEDSKYKKATSEVDKEFLELIEDWRLHLAKNIALKNNDLNIHNINYAVQRIIDRIIFLRIAEDRGVEDYGNLLEIAKDADNIFRSLNEYFTKADKKYNSELFKKDTFLENLKIEGDTLDSIIKSLYYPDCPYEFSVLPIEILGSIYECFLGKVIHLTDSHHARIEEKPEVKKAGGVYYTPQYIVDYIVENTVGEKIKDEIPQKIEKIKILDPACGSGSFLIGAFSRLLKHCLEYYAKDKDNIKKALKQGRIYQSFGSAYHLTIQEKQRILLNNIFGVDVDPQAVEVSKLSLLLRLMEGESQESTGDFFKYSDLKLLPNLSNNIKCGNSLIGSDFYRNKNLSLFGSEEMLKINVFDWEKQFPDIFKNGGFDIVIGNPPYGALFSKEEIDYLENKYKSLEYQLNSFVLFFEKGLNLLNHYGLLSYITPSVFLSQHYFKNIRKLILENYTIRKILNLNYKVFGNAETGDTCISVICKSKRSIELGNTIRYSSLKTTNELQSAIYKEIDQKELLNNPRYEINLGLDNKILKKIVSLSVPLKNIAVCIMGIKPYQKGKGRPKQNESIVKDRIFDSETKKTDEYKQYIIGSDIDRYTINPLKQRFIKYGEWLAEPRSTAPFERIKCATSARSGHNRLFLGL